MTRTTALISVVATLAVIGGAAYWFWSADKAMVPIPEPGEGSQNSHPNAIARQWQWDNFIASAPAGEKATSGKGEQQGDEESPAGEVPYDVVLIYNMLQNIQIDESGRLVPDQAAKHALERAFDDLGPDLSEESMAELQELIRIGLPGEPGKEAARIMASYYEYRLAEQDFNRDLEQQLANAGAGLASPDSRESYEELVQLRHRHLGQELADELFALEDLQARHMFATMEIQQNSELAQEEKRAELDELQDKLNKRLLALGELSPEEMAAQEVQSLRDSGASSAEIYAAREEILGPVRAEELAAADREEVRWQKRFESFWQARQRVMTAGLDDAERERQIEQLLAQHFSPEEQERARFTSLERQTQEME